jgi:cytochrome c peroxidase
MLRRRTYGLALGLLWLSGLGACGQDALDVSSFAWELPFGFPEPRVPNDNPMSQEKVSLGRRLFYDTRLSENRTQSCASCHRQSLAFTDGAPRSRGSTGELTPRSAMTLANAGYNATQTWANSLLRTLEQQALIPLFGEEPVELGFGGKENLLLDRLRTDAEYPGLFEEAFPDQEDPISVGSVTRALGAFQRTLVSGQSPYDRYLAGDTAAISEEAKRGAAMFFSEKLECFHCHGSFNLASAVDHQGLAFDQAQFENNGLYNIGGTGAYPPGNQGLYEISGRDSDRGRFRPPTLRNIGATAPYMHDGILETLDDVIDHYAQGGRLILDGPFAGDGRRHPNKSSFVSGFRLTADERAELKAFLDSLTDPTFLTDPRFSNPF